MVGYYPSSSVVDWDMIFTVINSSQNLIVWTISFSTAVNGTKESFYVPFVLFQGRMLGQSTSVCTKLTNNWKAMDWERFCFVLKQIFQNFSQTVKKVRNWLICNEQKHLFYKKGTTSCETKEHSLTFLFLNLWDGGLNGNVLCGLIPLLCFVLLMQWTG